MTERSNPPSNSGFPIAIGATTNQGGRTNNEDSYLVAEPPDPRVMAARGRLVVVADGMGGAAGGELASKLVVETIRDTYYATGGGDIAGALDAAIRRANSAVHAYAQQHPELQGMGSTCVAVAVCQGVAFYAHIGDSRAYLMREHKLYPLTEDHTRVNQMKRDGFLTADQARAHPQKHVLNRSMGPRPDVEVEVCPEPVQLQNGDRLFLCSDGLSDSVHEWEIAWFLDHHGPQEAADALAGFTLERHQDLVRAGQRGPEEQDNVTIQVVQVGAPAKAAGGKRPVPGTRAPPTRIGAGPLSGSTAEPRSRGVVWALLGIIGILSVALIAVLVAYSGRGGPGAQKPPGNAGLSAGSPLDARAAEPDAGATGERAPGAEVEESHSPAGASGEGAGEDVWGEPGQDADGAVTAGLDPETGIPGEKLKQINELTGGPRCLALNYERPDRKCRESLRRIFDVIEKYGLPERIDGDSALAMLEDASRRGWTHERSRNDLEDLVRKVQALQRLIDATTADGCPERDTFDKARAHFKDQLLVWSCSKGSGHRPADQERVHDHSYAPGAEAPESLAPGLQGGQRDPHRAGPKVPSGSRAGAARSAGAGAPATGARGRSATGRSPEARTPPGKAEDKGQPMPRGHAEPAPQPAPGGQPKESPRTPSEPPPPGPDGPAPLEKQPATGAPPKAATPESAQPLAPSPPKPAEKAAPAGDPASPPPSGGPPKPDARGVGDPGSADKAAGKESP